MWPDLTKLSTTTDIHALSIRDRELIVRALRSYVSHPEAPSDVIVAAQNLASELDY